MRLNSALLTSSGIARATLTIRPGGGPVFTPIIAALSLDPSAGWSASVTEVPSGAGRQLEVVGYDSGGIVLFRGSATADIAAGSSSSVVILLEQVSAPAGQMVTNPVVSVGISVAAVAPGGTATLTTQVRDTSGQPLSYAWLANCGTFANPSQPSTVWTASRVQYQRCQLSFTAANPYASTTVDVTVDVHPDPGSRSLTGRRLMRCWQDPTPGLTAPVISTIPAPDVYTLPAPDALVQTSPGVWSRYPGGRLMPDGTYYPGTFATDGTYYIPELSPAGPYVLWFHDSSGVLLLLDTTSLDVDLGYDQLGRCSSMIATAGTATLFQLAQLDPWNTTSSELQAASSGANTWRSIASGAQLLAGSTTASLLESWTDALLVPTDVLWLHQLSPQWHPSGFPYRASVRAAQVSQVLLPGGATTTVAAVLWPVPQSGAVSVNWTPSLFESSLGDMAPPARVASGIVPAHRLAVTASPFAARYPAPAPSAGSLQLATMDFPAGAGAVSLGSPLPYGRFLPSDWSEWREVRYAVAVGYQAPGATDVIYQISSVGQREAIPAPAGIAPALTPVRSPLINGSSALADQTVAVTGAPTFSWSPPATGTPSVYTLEIFSLQAAAGHSTAQLVLRYLTQSTSVTLPGGLLLSGGVYFARISALASDVPYLSAPLRYSPLLAEATALTGTFSP